MKLYKREGAYYADLRDVGGGRVSLRTTDPEIAKVRMREEYAKLGQQQGVKGGSLIELYRHCMTRLWPGHKDQNGIKYRWGRIAEHFGQTCPVSAVDYASLLAFSAALSKDGLSPQTVHRHMALISPMMAEAVKLKMIAAAPEIPWPKNAKSRVRGFVYSVEQEQMLLENLPRELKQLMIFLADTAFRVSETLHFELDLVNRKAVLRDQKNGTATATPLTARAFDAATEAPWRAMTADRLSKLWRTYAVIKLGLPDGANLHAWRHTCLTRLGNTPGITFKELQEFARHKDLKQTMAYWKLGGQGLDGCVTALEKCAMEGQLHGTLSHTNVTPLRRTGTSN